ncbi:MAG TPA: alanine racemase [Candidatus Binatia bacterium]|nr:alanine racemase [Candidatus Binatia bacterium]
MPETPQGRPTFCFVDHHALRWNLRQIREKVGSKVKILAMVKANAYGHGAAAVAKTLAAAGADAFGVATLEEGIELRHSGIGLPILVLAGAYDTQLTDFFAHSLTPVVHDLDRLKALEESVKKRGAILDVQLKIDTGRGRLGLAAAECDRWIGELKKLRALKIEGVFSHFSHAESVEGDYTRKQLEVFKAAVERLRAENIRPALVHFANSAATITLPAAYFDMVRPGIMLYGIYPSPAMASDISLKPVLEWKTQILQLKKVPAGASISYGQTFITKRESIIATLPIGYADGYPRLLSNRGEVLVGGQRASIAGRVCMDLTMVDVTDIRNVKQGDEVVLLGRQGDAEISADQIAAWANTISYEILTSISARVPRIHYNP